MQVGFKAGFLGCLIVATSAAGAGEAPGCIGALVEDLCPAAASQDEPVRICHWEFGYRAPEAQSFFEQVTSRARACPEDAAEQPPDMAVNHPDSYTLRQFAFETMLISVSLKDKAALERSFVFLRIDGTGTPDR